MKNISGAAATILVEAKQMNDADPQLAADVFYLAGREALIKIVIGI
jgi:hypothetical protein